MVHFSMAGHVVTDIPELGQVFLREISPHGEGGIQCGSAMALAQDKSVTIRPVGSGRINAHFVKI